MHEIADQNPKLVVHSSEIADHSPEIADHSPEIADQNPKLVVHNLEIVARTLTTMMVASRQPEAGHKQLVVAKR
jgi:hypothetical protein